MPVTKIVSGIAMKLIKAVQVKSNVTLCTLLSCVFAQCLQSLWVGASAKK